MQKDAREGKARIFSAIHVPDGILAFGIKQNRAAGIKEPDKIIGLWD